LLLEQASALEADLLVICKHARPTAEQFLLGSVTLRVLEDSLCDVLVVQ
jgi:nucleotide-binding universal stress UspA family protein